MGEERREAGEGADKRNSVGQAVGSRWKLPFHSSLPSLPLCLLMLTYLTPTLSHSSQLLARSLFRLLPAISGLKNFKCPV